MTSIGPVRLSKPRHRGSSSTVFKKRTTSEKNSLDLDRPWEEQSTGFVTDNYEWRGSTDSARGLGIGPASPASTRSARDVTFGVAASEFGARVPGVPYQHARSTSGTSHISHTSVATVGSPALPVRGGFVHPLKQTPREATLPLSSYTSALASFENGSSAADAYSPTIGASRSSLDLERPSLLQRRSNTLPQLQERQQELEELEEQDQYGDESSPFSQLSHVNTLPSTSASTPYTPSFPRRSFASHRSNSYSLATGGADPTGEHNNNNNNNNTALPTLAPRQPLRIFTSVTSAPSTRVQSQSSPSSSSKPSSAFAHKITSKSSLGLKKPRIPLGIITAGNSTVSPSLETASAASPPTATTTTTAVASLSSSAQPTSTSTSTSTSVPAPAPSLLRSSSQLSNHHHLNHPPTASSVQSTAATPMTPLSPLRGSFEIAGLRSRGTARPDADEMVHQHHVRLARREFEEKERAKAEKQRLKAERKREREDSKESKARTKAAGGQSNSVSRRNSSSTTDVRGAGTGTGTTTATATTTGTASSMLNPSTPDFSEKFASAPMQMPPTTSSAGGAAGNVKFEPVAATMGSADDKKRSVSMKHRTKAAWIAFIFWLRTRLLKLKFKTKTR
jgi:hypothetical protein